MQFQSTRNKTLRLSSAETIIKGLSEDGGLFVPVEIPHLEERELQELSKLSYCEKAKRILAKFMTDFSEEELLECAEKAYLGNFDKDEPTPIVKLGENEYILELWHGPTCAFKDMALQILPHFIVKSTKKLKSSDKTVILTATSGDTGKAALEGFRDVDGTEIVVFYPINRVSKIQKLQMQTQLGKNIAVYGVFGNFDDTQSEVKRIFTDDNANEVLKKNGKSFSSANSINIGRLLPQIVYYISAYTQLLSSGEIENGEKVNVTVPTGNFGNILAAYYAKRMGVPFAKFICASNSNNVLTEFFNTGHYNANRKFYLTDSPSMDILISSNLERLIFDFCEKDDKYIYKIMNSLNEHGEYFVSDDILKKLKEEFYAGYCDDTLCEDQINKFYNDFSFLCDTHTAVACKVYEDYKEKTGDEAKTIIASTASPYKFPKAVLKAISGKTIDDDFKAALEIEKFSGIQMPKQLKELSQKEIRFAETCKKDEMKNFVLSTVGGES